MCMCNRLGRGSDGGGGVCACVLTVLVFLHALCRVCGRDRNAGTSKTRQLRVWVDDNL